MLSQQNIELLPSDFSGYSIMLSKQLNNNLNYYNKFPSGTDAKKCIFVLDSWFIFKLVVDGEV